MEKLRIENLSTKEMTSVFAGGIFNKFFGPIGIIYTICGIVDDFQKVGRVWIIKQSIIKSKREKHQSFSLFDLMITATK